MAGIQAPKGFGILFAIVGVPLIVWSAAGTRRDLERLDASSSTESARIEACVAKTAEIVPDALIRRHVCGCVVDKAAAQGAFERYGAYDRDVLDPIVGKCLRGDRD
jgi:hypothetical protein